MSKNVSVTSESTPNPQSVKFQISEKISDESANFTTAMEAQRSPLASKLFGFPWTDGVYIGTDSVTLTKQDWVEWDVLVEPLCGLIKEHIDNDEVIMNPAPQTEANEDDSPVVQKIKKILNEEIRPAVALDGGDIVFSRFENKTVYIYMQGACAGCPSSSETLKFGIEARLKEAIEEVEEVIAL